MFTVRVIENPSLVTQSVCEYDTEREEEKKKHSEGCAVFKFAGGELYSQWPWSYRLLRDYIHCAAKFGPDLIFLIRQYIKMKLGHLQNVSLAILIMILQAHHGKRRCNEFNGAHLNWVKQPLGGWLWIYFFNFS